MGQTGLVVFNLDNITPVLIDSFKPKSSDNYGEKLNFIASSIRDIVKKYPPKIVVIERGFSKHNHSTQVTFRVHGLINYLFYKYEQIYYPPTTIKASILKGNAPKEEIRNKINENFPDIVFKNEDESDAFSVGLCYLIQNNLINWEK